MHSLFADNLLSKDDSIETLIASETGASERLNIYRNNLFSSLTEALQQSFPVTRELIGQDSFDALAIQYIQRHPPKSPVLLDYGEHFGEFMQTFEALRVNGYLREVAELEWHYLQSANEADELPVSEADLSVLLQDPEKLERSRLIFTAPTRILISDFPIFSIWSAHQGEARAELLKRIDLERPEALLLSRPGYQVRMHRLPAPDALFLRHLAAGYTLGDALSSAGEVDLVNLLRLLLEEQSIKSVGEQ